MKATGIVRRIDDLGRVVVPKEIRRTLRIREGDPLEIFTDQEGEIILKKYSPIGELGDFAFLNIGYRFQPKNGMIFRVGLSPKLPLGDSGSLGENITLWATSVIPYLSFGYAF